MLWWHSIGEWLLSFKCIFELKSKSCASLTLNVHIVLLYELIFKLLDWFHAFGYHILSTSIPYISKIACWRSRVLQERFDMVRCQRNKKHFNLRDWISVSDSALTLSMDEPERLIGTDSSFYLLDNQYHGSSACSQDSCCHESWRTWRFCLSPFNMTRHLAFSSSVLEGTLKLNT